MDIRVKRVHDEPSRDDGVRVLVDALWPRGISRERAAVDEWMREVAPSAELRRWFGHDPERFAEFRERFRVELRARGTVVAELRRKGVAGRLTLVYAARDRQRNNAVVLAEFLGEAPPGG